jgi:hypothetical protein
MAKRGDRAAANAAANVDRNRHERSKGIGLTGQRDYDKLPPRNLAERRSAQKLAKKQRPLNPLFGYTGASISDTLVEIEAPKRRRKQG